MEKGLAKLAPVHTKHRLVELAHVRPIAVGQTFWHSGRNKPLAILIPNHQLVPRRNVTTRGDQVIESFELRQSEGGLHGRHAEVVTKLIVPLEAPILANIARDDAFSCPPRQGPKSLAAGLADPGSVLPFVCD